MNRSLKKIQTVLDSVQGVEGGLKYDPTTGGFVATGSIIQDFDAQKSCLFPEKSLPVQNSELVTQDTVPVPSVSCNNGKSLAIKLEEDGCCIPTSHEEGVKKQNIPLMPQRDSKPIAIEGNKWGHSKNSLKLENSDCHFVSQSSSSLAVADDMDTGVDRDDGIVEYNQHTSSSMTDSTNCSGSTLRSSSSQSFEEQKQPNMNASSVENGSKITVKATYKEDTIRFKFDPSVGCFQLYEEVAKRLKLQNGTFQLKYLDDEEEWVMLVSDADLRECLEILDDIGTRSVKFMVRDTPFGVGSSGSSNCFLAGGL